MNAGDVSRVKPLTNFMLHVGCIYTFFQKYPFSNSIEVSM
jgi:hypothetical protein